MACFGVNILLIYSPHPCFISSSVFYPLIRILSPHPVFIPSSVFYPLICVLSSHPCFIPSSVFYLLICAIRICAIRIRIRVLSQHRISLPPAPVPHEYGHARWLITKRHLLYHYSIYNFKRHVARCIFSIVCNAIMMKAKH